MAAPLLFFSAAFAWHDSRLLTATNLLALAGAVGLGGLRRTQHRPQEASVSEYAAGFASAGVGTFTGALHLLTEEIPWREASRGLRGPRSAAIVRGAALGLPVVLLFGGLFMAADTVFAHYVTGVVPSFGHPASHIVFITVISWMGAGLLRDLVASREDERALSADWILRREAPRLGSTEIAIVLGSLDLLFLGFVLVQARYLFGGSALVASQAHLTYAQYARHGFYELVVVSALVLPVLLVANALALDRARLVRVRLAWSSQTGGIRWFACATSRRCSQLLRASGLGRRGRRVVAPTTSPSTTTPTTTPRIARVSRRPTTARTCAPVRRRRLD